MDPQPRLLELSAYINQNLEKDLPLVSLAKRVGLSPFHFHRKFGAYFGESLHQHIKRLRLERAAFALSYGSKPVREIARDSGYKTVSAFSHAFSTFSGRSPTQYRSDRPLARNTSTATDDAGQTAAPTWTGRLDDIAFAFVRTEGSGRGLQPAVERALGDVHELVREAPSTAKAPAPDALEGLDVIAATTDLYGVAKGETFRVDVGVDAADVPSAQRRRLGIQTLPGGRYARFDFACPHDEVIDRASRAFLEAVGEETRQARPAPCFVRFVVGRGAARGPRTYRLFVPLAG